MNVLKKIYRAWLKFGELLGTVNGYIILTIFYGVVIGLYSVIAMPFRRVSRQSNSDWKEVAKKELKLEDVKYQF